MYITQVILNSNRVSSNFGAKYWARSETYKRRVKHWLGDEMAVNNTNGTDDNDTGGQKKLTLRKPSSSTNLKLRKPSLSPTKPKLRNPENVQQQSTSEPDEIQGEKDAVPGLRLIKPSQSNDKNTDRDAIRLRQSGTQNEKVVLKNSPPTSPDQDLDPPSTVQRKRPLEPTSEHCERTSSPKLNLGGSIEEPEVSKLSVPGSLQLKKLEKESPSYLDTGTGLRLRKPSASTQKETSPSLKVDASSRGSTNGNENKDEEDVISTLTFKKPKPAGAANKLSLSSSLDHAAPDLTPPGLEAPAGLGASSVSLSQLSPPQAQKTKNDLAHTHSAIAPPLKKVQFSPKKKSGLTKKQKQQITLFGVPSLLILSGLVYLLLSIFFFPDPSSEDPPNSVTRPKPKVSKKSTKRTPPPPENQNQDQGQESASAVEDEGIAFPEHLIKELEEEYGNEAKQQFLEQWEALSDEERKSYLVEIGALNDE